MPGSSDKDKGVRAQALASVTQEMSSSRLRILGDLMESRKKAEQHEQEFLRTIHSENAAFSQIVSLFENSLSEVRDNAEQMSQRFESAVSKVDEVASERHEILRKDVSKHIDDAVKSVSESHGPLRDSIMQIEPQLTSLQARFGALTVQADAKIEDTVHALEESIQTVSTSIAKSIQNIEDQVSKLSDKITLASQRLLNLETETQERIDKLFCEMESRIQSRSSDIEALMESKIILLESRMRSLLAERIGGTEEQLEARMQERLEEEVNKVKTDVNESTDERVLGINKRLLALEQQQAILELQITQSRAAGSRNSETDIRLFELQSQIDSLVTETASRLSMQETRLMAVAHSGFHYDWDLTHPIPRLNSLGLLSTGGKHVNSDLFDVGPYKNLQLRLFPVNAPGTDSPTLWLIHRPVSADTPIPVYVDLSIGTHKRGPIKMKKVQELFGHWVWEAVFEGARIQSLVDSDSLRISVEISTRQWMLDSDITALAPMMAASPSTEEDDLPPSPSNMTSYTFAGPQELPLRPLTTNPFDRNEITLPAVSSKGSLTPRRSSWAQFGGTSPIADSNVEQSNPFR